MRGKIKIIVVDDQQLMREGLQTIIDLEEDLTTLGTTANGREALGLCRQLGPDIVLMDIRMPEMDGVEATRYIAEECPDTKVIILTTFDDDELIIKAMKAGAKTFLLKDLPSEKLFETIRATHKGNIMLQPEIAAKLVGRAAGSEKIDTAKVTALEIDLLTKREKEILNLMADGLSNSDIASKLFLSEGTVKNQVSVIYSKLGTNDRTQAVLLALNKYLI